MIVLLVMIQGLNVHKSHTNEYTNCTATRSTYKSEYLYCTMKLIYFHFFVFRYIGYSMDAEVIQRQDAIDALTFIAQTAVGRRLSWKHLTDNWKFFMDE